MRIHISFVLSVKRAVCCDMHIQYMCMSNLFLSFSFVLLLHFDFAHAQKNVSQKHRYRFACNWTMKKQTHIGKLSHMQFYVGVFICLCERMYVGMFNAYNNKSIWRVLMHMTFTRDSVGHKYKFHLSLIEKREKQCLLRSWKRLCFV